MDNSARTERRGKPRIEMAYPALVRGVNAQGGAFEMRALLRNLGAGGLYLHLPERVECGAQLYALVRLSTAPPNQGPAPRVATRGVIVRVEAQADGSYGVAVAFIHHRFLYE